MDWLKSINPFKKKEEEKPAAEGQLPPGMPPELAKMADSPMTKGMMAKLMGKMKDPTFLKQLRALAVHMQREGVDVKDMGAVKAWLDKNKDRIEKGEFNEPPKGGPGETFVKSGPEVGRNDPCHCGSGKKFKKCHGA